MTEYKHQSKCGPQAVEFYNFYKNIHRYRNGVRYDFFYRKNVVKGSGKVETCNVDNKYRCGYEYETDVEICEGITIIGKSCYSIDSIVSVELPSSLIEIEDGCFRKSLITSIKLPENLQKIGHDNFPRTLFSINIPSKLIDFPIDNIAVSDCLDFIDVSPDNPSYQLVDGILFNKEMTEILFCTPAHEGDVVIPNTVHTIGNYCFRYCKKLSKIIIPASVKEIQDYAFSEVELDRLKIPNSVVKLGKYCFYRAKITSEFHMSASVVELPDSCFKQAEIPYNVSLKKMLYIGDACFEDDTAFLEFVSLEKANYCGARAFYGQMKLKFLELFSNVRQIGEDVLKDTAEDMNLVYYSLVPIPIDKNAFNNLGASATLYVPKGCGMIFENAVPWCIFPHIKEMDLSESIEGDTKREISDEDYYKKLQSLVHSAATVDREYVSSVLSGLALSFNSVDSEEDYRRAKELIRYNRLFSPVLIEDFERKLSCDWSNRYKLRLVDDFMTSCFSVNQNITYRGDGDISLNAGKKNVYSVFNLLDM